MLNLPRKPLPGTANTMLSSQPTFPIELRKRTSGLILRTLPNKPVKNTRRGYRVRAWATPRKHLPFLGVRFLTSHKTKKVSYVSLPEFKKVGLATLRQPNTGKLIDTDASPVYLNPFLLRAFIGHRQGHSARRLRLPTKASQKRLLIGNIRFFSPLPSIPLLWQV